MISGSHMGKLVAHSFMKSILKDLEGKDIIPEDLKIYLSIQKIVMDIEQELKLR
jgi:hypothetical protein